MRRTASSISSNPILIGGVTVLVVVVAVFLAYNANSGLPFVPTYDFKVDSPDAARLVVGNEVREGGERVGQITEIDPVRLADGSLGASLGVSLDETAGPIPIDSTALIRPRSTLGLKYIDLVRGEADRMLPEGATISIGEGAIPPELDDFFEIFREDTREDARRNLEAFGGGLAGRGDAINRTLASLPELLRDIRPVMQTLADPGTGLRRFVRELEDAARVVAPVSESFARGFTAGADTFEAFSRDPAALEETIAESPPTLSAGIRSFAIQRPFLRHLASLSTDLRATAAEVRVSAPPINRALAAGTPVLRRTPQLNEDLEIAMRALADLSRSPTTDLVLGGLTDTMRTLRPTLRYVGPHITVCNYWNYWWTYFQDHISERNDTGTIQRIQAKSAPRQDNQLSSFGATQPANAENVFEPSTEIFGDPVRLHAQPYGRAVDAGGRADCESGQRGYPRRLAEGAPPEYQIVVDPRTPGRQGPTFTGRPRVPEGQTYSAEPTGSAPKVVATP